jgi:TonB family protein
MGFPGKNLLRLFAKRDPASPETGSGENSAFSPKGSAGDELGLWHDVFVEQPLPWKRFVQSVVLHGAALALIWVVSLSLIRQQKILDRAAFDRAALVTYTPDEYLPPLDTGASEAKKTQKGDPAFAKQPILSVPREADNTSQTIVAPPDLKLNRDVPMPNIVATGNVTPVVPLEATSVSRNRLVAPDTQVVPPSPDVQFAPDRIVRSAMKSDVIAPPPEVVAQHSRGVTGPQTSVVEPPPELTQSTKGNVGLMNIGPSTVVAPAPQLAMSAQHSLAARGKGNLAGGAVQPVGPPPSMSAGGGANSNGRLVALGIHPMAASGPVAAPSGNRRGTFSANPHGKPGASGTPDLVGSKADAKGSGSRGDSGGDFNTRNKGSLPSGLHVGGADSDANSDSGGREMASAAGGPVSRPGARAASVVSDEKLTDIDRQVFGGKRVYSNTLNMPNLNSSTGSWMMKFAELSGGHKDGELLRPEAREQSDPGYPLELMKSNVHGTVTLYAVINSDGKVTDIRVLNSPDDRLDSYAAQALARWKFAPAVRAGKPVALVAVVEIPFRVRRGF